MHSTRSAWDYDALSAELPRLVYCSLKGFLSGPYEQRVALDEVVQMMGGLAYMTGPPGQPLRAGASVNDVMGAVFAVVGIVSAFYERERTGRGKLVKSGCSRTARFSSRSTWLVSRSPVSSRGRCRCASRAGGSTTSSRLATMSRSFWPS